MLFGKEQSLSPMLSSGSVYSVPEVEWRFLAGLRPRTGDPLRCADVFTAIDDVNILQHI